MKILTFEELKVSVATMTTREFLVTSRISGILSLYEERGYVLCSSVSKVLGEAKDQPGAYLVRPYGGLHQDRVEITFISKGTLAHVLGQI